MKEMMNDIYFFSLREMLKDCLCEVQASASKSSLPGISSGFKPLDDLTGGFENGKVYVIGGRPCMGKEEFMLSMIKDIIMESNLPVLLFSTNHMKPDYVERILTIHCDIPTTLLFIHDSLDLPLNELAETARYCIRGTGAGIIFIDCLQMIDFTAKEDNNSSEKIAKVMYSLKQLASITNIPIVVGSMLSRGVEYREGFEGRQPQLGDLANSSYIEGLADVIILVHRPEYYRIYEDIHGQNLNGLMEIFVKKNNLKPSGSFFLEYHQDTGVVCIRKSKVKSASEPISLKNLNTDNKAVQSLIEVFDLEDELPF